MKHFLILLTFIMSPLCLCAQNIQQIMDKAKAGDAYSQYLLGWSYANASNGIASCDYESAIPWFEKAANNGFAAAAFYLGCCYEYGYGRDKNFDLALSWYGKSGTLGMEEGKAAVKRLQKIGSLGPSYNKSNNNILIDTFDPSKPPILEIVDGTIKFLDPNGNNAIDAGEKCSLIFEVVNKGKGTAVGCVASIQSADINKSLRFVPIKISSIAPEKTQQIILPIEAAISLGSGKFDFCVQVNEPHGFGTDQIQMSVNTKEFVAPKLKVVDYSITSDKGDKLQKKHPFDMQVLLQNIEYGTAEDVTVSFIAPKGVIIMNESNKNVNYSVIGGGTTKSLDYSLIVTNDFEGTTIPIEINIREKYGKYAENKHIDLQLNQNLAANKIVVEEKESQEKSFTIETASLTSDVDKNIPETKELDENTFAVVIANEAYNKEAGVPFAANDGKVFAEYCKKTLGLPDTNIKLLTNATLNDMKHEIAWLKKIIETRDGEAKIIFYYAGHGIPDEKNHHAYLLPVDGYGNDVSTGYSLESLYEELGAKESKSVLILLDACFSGSKREGDMLASARGIALKADRGEPQGNMIVLSAAQGDETAYPYKKEGHGLFTYYLLKKIQETSGNITISELGDYVHNQVSKQSIVINSKPQTPTIITSNSINKDWGKWKLKF